MFPNDMTAFSVRDAYGSGTLHAKVETVEEGANTNTKVLHIYSVGVVSLFKNEVLAFLNFVHSAKNELSEGS